MSLPVDNQLPVALARYLAANGFECVHVCDVGLEAAEDCEIWEYAKGRRQAIVSKDDDFQILAAGKGTPLQVVWMRIGNCRKSSLLDAFTKILPALRAMLDEGKGVIEIP